MNKYSHRVEAIEHYVYSLIILQIVYQVRFVNVVLYNEATLCGTVLNDFFTLSAKVDSLTLRESFRFNDVSFLFLKWLTRFLVDELISEICTLLRYQPCLRKKFVIVRESSLHFHKVSSQVILSCYYVHAWKLIYLLIGLHFGQIISCYSQIMP